MLFLYYTALIALIILHFRNVRNDKREQGYFDAFDYEIRVRGLHRQETFAFIAQMEDVNQHKTYRKDKKGNELGKYADKISRYKDVTGKLNKAVGRQVYKGEHKPSEAYEPIEIYYSSLSLKDFEMKVCYELADGGFFKDAFIRWTNFVQKYGKVTIKEEKETFTEWTISAHMSFTEPLPSSA